VIASVVVAHDAGASAGAGTSRAANRSAIATRATNAAEGARRAASSASPGSARRITAAAAPRAAAEAGQAWIGKARHFIGARRRAAYAGYAIRHRILRRPAATRRAIASTSRSSSRIAWATRPGRRCAASGAAYAVTGYLTKRAGSARANLR
jgi:hypothetical protein